MKESKKLHAQNLTRFYLIIFYALCCAVLTYPLVIYNIVSPDNHWGVMFWYPVSVDSSLEFCRMMFKIPFVYQPFIYSAMVVLLAYFISTQKYTQRMLYIVKQLDNKRMINIDVLEFKKS